MRILDRLIVSDFLRVFVLTILSFISLFLIVDLFEKVDDFLEHGVPLSVMAVFFILKVPFIFSQVSPVAVLLSVLLTLGMLARNSEITAMKAGGISILRIVSPLLAVGLLITVVVVMVNESVTPVAMKKVETIEKRWLGGMDTGIFGSEGFWLRNRAGIYNIREIDINNNVLRGISFFEIKRPFSLKSRTHAREARWQDNGWVAERARRWALKKDGLLKESRVRGFVFPELKAPEGLLTMERSYERMSLFELNEYINELEREGYGTDKYRVELLSRLTFPGVNFIMVLLGIPFALKTGRQGGVAAGIALSVAIGFSFWIVFALCRSLGQNGILPPIVAASFPDILFLAIGAYMFGQVRQ